MLNPLRQNSHSSPCPFPSTWHSFSCGPLHTTAEPARDTPPPPAQIDSSSAPPQWIKPSHNRHKPCRVQEMRSMLHTTGGRRPDLPLRLPLLLLLCFCLIKSSAAAATSRICNGGYRATCLAFAPVFPTSAKTWYRPTRCSSNPAVCSPLCPRLPSSRDGVVRHATKGNKKNRTSRRRKSDDDDEDCDSDSEECQAPRVSSQINIPVRRQIAFVKQMKKLMKAEERPKEVAKKARRKKDPTQREAISGDYARFDQSMCSTYLLVDGYNVIK